MTLSRNNIIPFFAIIILIIGAFSTIYVHANQKEIGDTIKIADEIYKYNRLFEICEYRELNDTEFNGIALDDMILKADVYSPENYEYIIIGLDEYQKTVSWDNMKKGVMTKEKKVVFSDLPKAFWIRDVVEIKLK